MERRNWIVVLRETRPEWERAYERRSGRYALTSELLINAQEFAIPRRPAVLLGTARGAKQNGYGQGTAKPRPRTPGIRKGVRSRGGKWQAYIVIEGKATHRTFDTPEAAEKWLAQVLKRGRV